MGQCSNRPVDEASDIQPQAVSLDKARSRSSNAAVTSARYHFFQNGRRLLDDYEVDGTVLGHGLCGEVVLARGRIDRRRYALKTIRKLQVPPSRLQQLTSEVEIYLALDHPNIARLHDVYETEADISLLTECCEGGELYYRLQKRGVYTNDDAAEATRQMFRAVGYLHRHNVVHRDLKLENFLYEDKGDSAQLKLIDFGFAKVWDPSTLMMASCGSIAYVSPDVVCGHGYTNKCDMWSLGVIVWMLLAGYPPFHGEEKVMMQKIKAAQADWSHKSRWKPVAPEAIDLIRRLLQKDPSRRPSAQEALQHPWLVQTAKLGSPSVALSREALRSMHRYAEASKVRRAVLQLLAQELAPDETRELRELFVAIDQSNEGTISLRDLKNAIRSGGSRSPTRRAKAPEEPTSGPSSPARHGAGENLLSPTGASHRGSGGHFESEGHASEGGSSPRTPARALRRATSGMLDELFGLLDANGHQRIYYSDFLAATMEVRSRLREEAVRAAFNRLDADGSGAICAADFRSVLGSTFEGVDVEELVRQADPRGRGAIDFTTFVKVLEDHDEVPTTPSSATLPRFAALGSPTRRRAGFFMEEAYGGC